MNLAIELEQEDDGRWLAEIEDKLGRKVDWATTDALSKYIVDSVMQDLQVIYVKREFVAA